MKALVVAIALCACSSTHGTGPGSGSVGGGGNGVGSAPPVAHAKTCDEVKARVEQMYRAEAQVNEPKRVEQAVADNTTMVMNDCAKDPAKAVPCLAKAGTVGELEKQCLIQLDDEGTEGQAVAK